MLEEYAASAPQRYHMPGHKGRAGGFLSAASAFDITELYCSDNLYCPTGPIAQAQSLAAEAFGAYKSYFVTCGSSIGISVMLHAALQETDEVLLFRNSHRSVLDSLCLIGAKPVYIQNPQGENGLLLPPCLEDIKNAINAHPGAKALLVTSPDYFGVCPDLEAIASMAHSAGMLLLVDEAHGAHLPFYPQLPKSAGAAGADMWVQSAHKTLGALTQGALLHINSPAFEKRVEKLLPMLSTSSPSYLIMSSMDKARAELFTTIDRSRFIEKIRQLRAEISAIGGLSLLAAPSGCTQDITRLVVDTSKFATGFLAQELLIQQGIVPECADFFRVVFILTPYDDDYAPLITALKALTRKAQSPVPCPPLMPKHLPRQVLLPRRAAFAPQEEVPLHKSIGRIAAVSFGVYPPGVPIFALGEQINKEGLEYINTMVSAGASTFGITAGCVSVIK